MEICYNLLQTEEDIGKYAPEALNAPEADSAAAIETPMPENADSDEEHSPATNGVDSQSPDKPKAKSSRKRFAA